MSNQKQQPQSQSQAQQPSINAEQVKKAKELEAKKQAAARNGKEIKK